MNQPWMRVESVPEMTLEEFAKREGLELVIRERRVGTHNPDRYYARLTGAEVKEGSILSSACGDGQTPAFAAAAYAAKISMRRLVIHAYASDRREIDVPRLTVPERCAP